MLVFVFDVLMLSLQVVVGDELPALKAPKKSRSSVKLMTDLCYSSKFALLLLLLFPHFHSQSLDEIECPTITSKEVATTTTLKLLTDRTKPQIL